ncbi:MAG: ABC-F family ATP-binding cassette domain-containing protein [Erysipelotrichaceae bacterium]|nr:ABC-F family ATP-binding cassette domain-containing protein [Erysipelotrichaceae bacterium]
MLTINHLTVTTLKGRVLLKDFSFTLNKGEKIALIGEEGNGKSTLLKIIAREDVSDYVTLEGDIYTKDRVAYLPQHIRKEDEELNVRTFIEKDETDIRKLYSLFNEIGIERDILDGRKMKDLSGGERVKASLARVLYEEPDILLLDEPSNDIDLQTMIWLEDFISSASQGIIFISHDETLLRNCAEGILHLEQLKRKQEARITYSGEGYDSYFKQRLHWIDRNNQISKKEHGQFRKQLERYRQIYQKVEHRQKTISRGDPHGGQLLKKKMHSLKSQGRKMDEKEKELTKKFEPEEAIAIRFEDIRMPPSKMILDMHLDELKIDNLHLSKNIDLYMEGKDRICIIGENGTGKTTLLKMIYEELKDREDITLGYMPQDYREVLDYDKTPIEILYDACNDKTKARNMLGSLKFTSEEMTHPVSELSEGQKCKVLLAQLILRKCDVLLLDEPSRNLSPLSNPELRRILQEFKGAILSVSHDRLFIDEVSTKIYELTKDGLKLIDG